jgi:hypothetical protein
MSAAPATLRMVEISDTEALWPFPGAASSRLVSVQRDPTVVRPARHVWELGRLVVRTPLRAAAAHLSVTDDVDKVRAASGTGTGTGTGWTVPLTGPAEATADPHEAVHNRRTLAGRSHGPHDAIVCIRPRTVSGLRPVPGTES